MLMPKKVKYRKQQRGRRKGKAWRGGKLSFGEYGLKAMENAWITDRQIEASRVAITRFIKRGGKKNRTPHPRFASASRGRPTLSRGSNGGGTKTRRIDAKRNFYDLGHELGILCEQRVFGVIV